MPIIEPPTNPQPRDYSRTIKAEDTAAANQPCSSAQQAQIAGLIQDLKIPTEGQGAIMAKRGVVDVSELSRLQAHELIEAMENRLAADTIGQSLMAGNDAGAGTSIATTPAN
jgi:hypothetical protein